MSKTFLFQFIQTVLIPLVKFSISTYFVCIQLNVKTVLYITIQFRVSTVSMSISLSSSLSLSIYIYIYTRVSHVLESRQREKASEREREREREWERESGREGSLRVDTGQRLYSRRQNYIYCLSLPCVFLCLFTVQSCVSQIFIMPLLKVKTPFSEQLHASSCHLSFISYTASSDILLV